MERIVSLPIFITKEGNWFIACCPILDIATQGRTEEEVKQNIRDLIEEYMKDPDTYKPPIDVIVSSSVVMTTISVRIDDVKYSKTSTLASA